MPIKILVGLGVVVEATSGHYRTQRKCSKQTSEWNWVSFPPILIERMVHSHIHSIVDITLKFWQHVSEKLTTSPPFIPWRMGKCWSGEVSEETERRFVNLSIIIVLRAGLFQEQVWIEGEHNDFSILELYFLGFLCNWPPRIINCYYSINGWHSNIYESV